MVQQFVNYQTNKKELKISLTAVDQNNMLNQPRSLFYAVDQPKYGTAYIDGNTLIFTQKKIY